MINQPGSPALYLDMASASFSTRSDEVNQARDQHWCARTPYGLAVLRHREAGLLLRDKRLRQGSYAWPDKNNLRGSFAEFWKRSIISQEGSTHRALRELVVPALSPDFIESLKPEFSNIAQALCADLKTRNTCEFMSDFSVPFAAQAICILLGLPVERWPEISDDASNLGLAMGVECKKHEGIYNAACDRLMRLSDELIARVRSGEDRESYIARLVTRFDTMDEISLQDLWDLIVMSIFGGVDTTRAQLGFIMSLFIEYPEQWKLMCADHALIANTVEESIRARPTTTWATREAIEDFTFGGETIQAGETIHVLVHSSARDRAICEKPQFDITAKRKIHFGFGGGAHHCIGHLTARTDMACALEALSQTLKEFSWYELPRFLPDSGNTSPEYLPIKYTLFTE